MNVKLVTAPAVEPLTLAEAKTHLRVEISDDDALITAQIAAARVQAELWTWRALITQTWDLFLDVWPDDPVIELPKPPLQSVTSVTYRASTGASYTLPTSDYAVDAGTDLGRVVLKYDKSWPTVTLAADNPITVRFVAGYGVAADVPQLLKQGMLFLLGHFYENREAVALTNAQLLRLPLAVDSIFTLYKVR